MNWRDATYLRSGTERQRAAYAALTALDLLPVLAPYDPVLAGTVPLDLDLPSSDLDVICEVHDAGAFESLLREHYAARDGYEVIRRPLSEATICRFRADGFPIEVYGQPLPVYWSRAYVHLVVEGRLLALAGGEARHAIRELKQAGLKTEPAFARYFHLPFDPYVSLYALAGSSDAELRALIERARVARDM